MSFLLQKFKKEENKQMPKIVFNENFGVDEITIVLERRDFSKYGKLKDVTDIEYKDTMNAPELSFNVYKTDDQI